MVTAILVFSAWSAYSAALPPASSAHSAAAQTENLRPRALPLYREGWVQMRSEAWEQAAKMFQQAIEIDPRFEDAYYGLGRANMGLRRFDAAIAAYTKCQEMYKAEAGRQFATRQDAQRYRQDRLTEIDALLRELQSGPQTALIQDRQRQLAQQRQQIQQNIDRSGNMTLSAGVPAFVSLALGSAYFRAERLADAEKAYRMALDADPSSGEIQNNLAVVYFTSGRYDEADKAVQAAEKAGFKVHPGLKDDIKKKKSGGLHHH
jgi:tetratricopeptide (TPR) repeat protein